MDEQEQHQAAEMVLDAAFDMAERIRKLEMVNEDLCDFIERQAKKIEECEGRILRPESKANEYRAMVAAAKAVLK